MKILQLRRNYEQSCCAGPNVTSRHAGPGPSVKGVRSRCPVAIRLRALAQPEPGAPQLSMALEEHPSGCKLPPGYGGLLDRFIDVVGGDPRVRAAWVHGSVARGDADEVSDLDVIIAVADDDIPAFAAGWRDRLDEVTPTVMARPSHGTSGSWLAITPACQRFDLWVEPASSVASSPVHDRHVLFDHDGLDALVPAPPPRSAALSRQAPGPRPTLQRRRVCRASGRRAPHAPGHLGAPLDPLRRLRRVESSAPTDGAQARGAPSSPTPNAPPSSALPTSGDPAPVIAALEDVLGKLPAQLPGPVLQDVVVPPEGVIRGLRHRLRARWDLGTQRGRGVLCASLVPDGRDSPS